ncbi:MAG: oligosaccharide flippase family protein [Caulobacteraceae bacterium]|nr:oligosaccharide flippase family protein [Caulobacteraceae bacterium]
MTADLAEPATARSGGSLYFAAILISLGAAVLRYVAVARLLGPEQLGIAAILLITGAFFDLITDTGGDRFLIQDRHGGAFRVQKLVQLVWAARGVTIAVALVVLAEPIARFYRAPRLAEGLMLLALSPLIQGFLHLDVRRAQRDHDFRPHGISMIAAELAGLAATVAAAWLTGDFTAVVYGLIARSLVLVAASHLMAERPYRLGWDRRYAPRLARFAAPLTVNGMLLFLAAQGDRVIISQQLGLTALGYYSAVSQLIAYPSIVVANYLHAIYIPLIAAQRDMPGGAERVGDWLGGQVLVLAVIMAAGFALVAPVATPLLFGARFAQPVLMIALVGVLQMARSLLTWPTTVALAVGRSATVALSNLAHVVALLTAFIGLRVWGGIDGLLGGLVVGELAASAFAVVMLNRDTGSRVSHGMDRLALFALSAAVVVAWTLVWEVKSWAAAGAMLLVSAGLAAFLLRREAEAIALGMDEIRRLAAPLWPRQRARQEG